MTCALVTGGVGLLMVYLLAEPRVTTTWEVVSFNFISVQFLRLNGSVLTRSHTRSIRTHLRPVFFCCLLFFCFLVVNHLDGESANVALPQRKSLNVIILIFYYYSQEKKKKKKPTILLTYRNVLHTGVHILYLSKHNV